MLKKPTEKEMEYRNKIAREVIKSVQGIDASVLDVAQEMVLMGAAQMKHHGVDTADIIKMVKDIRFVKTKTKLN
jgi:hypothetical protein